MLLCMLRASSQQQFDPSCSPLWLFVILLYTEQLNLDAMIRSEDEQNEIHGFVHQQVPTEY